MCNMYNDGFYRSQITAIAKSTGCKGSYPLMNLGGHDPMQQTVPDSMHTIKDAVEHYFYLIVGKENSSAKTLQCEQELRRFASRASTVNNTTVPYTITKEQVKIADVRACSIVCPQHVDYKSSAFFSKTHFKSHDWKQVKLQRLNSALTCISLHACNHTDCSSRHSEILPTGDACS